MRLVPGFSALDFTLGLRMLRRYPGITTVGTVAIAVAVGLGSAYFETVDKFVNPRYLDIVPDRRIVIAYTMAIDGTNISASLGTVEFEAVGGGTRLIYTEQGAFFDGADGPSSRQQGWHGLLERLAAMLRKKTPDRT
jgi:uncharacterized protein YndB with AHSA1/START domain